jgi:hypothetical protein
MSREHDIERMVEHIRDSANSVHDLCDEVEIGAIETVNQIQTEIEALQRYTTRLQHLMEDD